ncbi:MAG: DDE-type integrase/transposase/recombinase, partial [Bacillota bacterium]
VARVAVHRTGRPPIYTREVKEALVRVWTILTFPAGKRLAPFLPEVVPVLERWGELSLTPEVRERLLRISAATVDRLLARERQRLQIKGRSGTKPGSLLKGAIPIRTFAEWDDTRPGFLEVDLVGHDGGDARGDFAQTLDMVDVATGWIETVAVRNKAQKWVVDALQRRLLAFPFPILGIDSDNGAEFINAQLLRFFESHRITFTRSRPYRKNDNGHVEQENWSVVRRYVGYLRYDTPRAGRAARRPLLPAAAVHELLSARPEAGAERAARRPGAALLRRPPDAVPPGAGPSGHLRETQGRLAPALCDAEPGRVAPPDYRAPGPAGRPGRARPTPGRGIQ